jgi:hypothetical protein
VDLCFSSISSRAHHHDGRCVAVHRTNKGEIEANGTEAQNERGRHRVRKQLSLQQHDLRAQLACNKTYQGNAAAVRWHATPAAYRALESWGSSPGVFRSSIVLSTQRRSQRNGSGSKPPASDQHGISPVDRGIAWGDQWGAGAARGMNDALQVAPWPRSQCDLTPWTVSISGLDYQRSSCVRPPGSPRSSRSLDPLAPYHPHHPPAPPPLPAAAWCVLLSLQRYRRATRTCYGRNQIDQKQVCPDPPSQRRLPDEGAKTQLSRVHVSTWLAVHTHDHARWPTRPFPFSCSFFHTGERAPGRTQVIPYPVGLLFAEVLGCQ